MEILVRKAITLFLLVFLCSCSVLEVKPERVSIQPQVKNFVFMEKLPSGKVISDAKVYKEITNQIKRNSKIRGLGKSHSGSGSLYHLKGMIVKRAGNVINVSYINGDFHAHNNSTYKTEISAVYKVEIKTKNGEKHVSVYSPSEVNLRPGRSVIMIPIRPLISTAQAVLDIKKINEGLSPVFKDTKDYSGEINVKYNDESVYANFTRLLGEYKYGSDDVKKYDIEKDKLFTMGKDGDEFPVKISVFPYRNGSKVTYEFRSMYDVNNDGTTTFDDKKIQEYIARIKNVAND